MEQQVWASLENMCSQDQGAHYSVFSQNGIVTTIFFQTSHMKKLFSSYSDVLYIDSTYCLNQLGYPVVVFMVVDGDNVGHCVGYAIVRDERMVTLAVLFHEFVKNNVGVNVKTVVVDKDASEIGALRLSMPDCQLVLCRFHVAKSLYDAVVKYCVKEDREEMHRRVSKLLMCASEELFFVTLSDISGSLKEYLNKNWLPIIDSWANFKTKHYVTWGNKTNNFVERHNRALKTIASSKTSLSLFVRELLTFHRGEELKLKKKLKDLNLRSRVLRPKFIDNVPVLQRAYSLLTPYACNLIKKELDKTKENVSILSQHTLTVFRSDGSEKDYNLQGCVCQCLHFVEKRLPCWHLLEYCEKTKIDCFVSIPDRYLKSNYLNCLGSTSLESAPVSSSHLQVVEHKKEKSEWQKRLLM